MRFYGLALFAGAAALGACGGGDHNATMDSAAMAAPPVTGKTVEIKMLQDAQGNYKYDPANVTIKQGDGLKFIMVSGGPHNVAFDPATLPEPAKAPLMANMPNQMSELSSPLMTQPNETYTISFANVPAGKYDFHCTPHLAMGMRGSVTVQ